MTLNVQKDKKMNLIQYGAVCPIIYKKLLTRQFTKQHKEKNLRKIQIITDFIELDSETIQGILSDKIECPSFIVQCGEMTYDSRQCYEYEKIPRIMKEILENNGDPIG